MSAEQPQDAARQLPASASVVIIGAGIVGNSIAHHLARLGATELVLLDKGPLPNPGGSTGHASNFIFPVDHSQRDDGADGRERAPVPRPRRVHASAAASRWRARPSACRS